MDYSVASVYSNNVELDTNSKPSKMKTSVFMILMFCIIHSSISFTLPNIDQVPEDMTRVRRQIDVTGRRIGDGGNIEVKSVPVDTDRTKVGVYAGANLQPPTKVDPYVGFQAHRDLTPNTGIDLLGKANVGRGSDWERISPTIGSKLTSKFDNGMETSVFGKANLGSSHIYPSYGAEVRKNFGEVHPLTLSGRADFQNTPLGKPVQQYGIGLEKRFGRNDEFSVGGRATHVQPPIGRSQQRFDFGGSWNF